jgi:hypothetical protein
MNDKLQSLIGEASARIAATNAEREAERVRQQQMEKDRDAALFKTKVESVLGKEVLDAIGPVVFVRDFLSQSMTFTQQSRSFRLKQQVEFLVQLEENNRMFGHQFNLSNADSRDVFLDMLGTALKQTDGFKRAKA